MSEKKLISSAYMELLRLNGKKKKKNQISWFKTWQRPWMDISSKNIYNRQQVYEKVFNITNKLLLSR